MPQATSSIENDDGLKKRLKEATAEDSRQLLEEFLKAFFLDQSEVAVDRRPPVLADHEMEEVTFEGYSAG